MGVVISGIKMPKNCLDCPCFNSEEMYCQVTCKNLGLAFASLYKASNCPLVPFDAGKKTDTTNYMRCYFCGAPLRWEADFSFADYGIDDQQGVVSDYSCDNRDTSYQIFKPFKSEESEDN